MRILVANKPRAYREVICETIRMLCPLAEVSVTEPEHLDQEAIRLLPQLVICSHLTEAVQASASSWIELYPEESSSVTVSVLGNRTVLTRMNLEGLLSVVDQAGYLRDASVASA